VWMLWSYRQHWHAARDLPVMVAAGTVGAAVGTAGLVILEARWLSLALGIVVILYLASRVADRSVALPPQVTRVTAAPVALVAGLRQGSTGMSGPLLMMYLHSMRLARQVFVVSIVTLFLVFATAQTFMLVMLGLFDQPRLTQSFLALIPIMLMLWLAQRYTHRLSAATFDRWVLLLLAVFAAKLIYDGIIG
jgi:uncharacterized protein